MNFAANYPARITACLHGSSRTTLLPLPLSFTALLSAIVNHFKLRPETKPFIRIYVRENVYPIAYHSSAPQSHVGGEVIENTFFLLRDADVIDVDIEDREYDAVDEIKPAQKKQRIEPTESNGNSMAVTNWHSEIGRVAMNGERNNLISPVNQPNVSPHSQVPLTHPSTQQSVPAVPAPVSLMPTMINDAPQNIPVFINQNVPTTAIQDIPLPATTTPVVLNPPIAPSPASAVYSSPSPPISASSASNQAVPSLSVQWTPAKVASSENTNANTTYSPVVPLSNSQAQTSSNVTNLLHTPAKSPQPIQSYPPVNSSSPLGTPSVSAAASAVPLVSSSPSNSAKALASSVPPVSTTTAAMPSTPASASVAVSAPASASTNSAASAPSSEAKTSSQVQVTVIQNPPNERGQVHFKVNARKPLAKLKSTFASQVALKPLANITFTVQRTGHVVEDQDTSEALGFQHREVIIANIRS